MATLGESGAAWAWRIRWTTLSGHTYSSKVYCCRSHAEEAARRHARSSTAIYSYTCIRIEPTYQANGRTWSSELEMAS